MMRRSRHEPPLPLALALVWASSACADPEAGAPPDAGAAPRPWFAEAPAGLAAAGAHAPGDEDAYLDPQIMGPGGALFDADGDGDLDVYLVRGGAEPRASRNVLLLREGDGCVVAGAASGVGHEGYGQGCAVGDVDNDGDLDLYLANWGPDALLVNDGRARFTDRTRAAGLGQEAWACSAAFGDLDADGALDLFVATYLDYDPERVCRDLAGRRDYCGPGPFAGLPDRHYRNRGDGTFEDVGAASGVAARAGKGLGVLVVDVDEDGRQDVVVANDGQPNHLWRQRADGRFEERAVLAGLATNAHGAAEASMGIACADADADGDLDLFMTHLDGETNTLYLAGPGGLFRDATLEAGLAGASRARTGFGVVMADFDLDGALDLVLANGRVFGDPERPDRWGRYAEPDQLLVGLSPGRWRAAAGEGGALGRAAAIGRGLAAGDWDGDGDPDLLLAQAAGPARLLRDDAPRRGRGVVLDLREPATRRAAIGARVLVTAGGRTRAALVTRAGSYASAGDATVLMGLGEVERVDGLVVVWPDGTRETFAPPPLDRRVTIARGEGR